MSGFGEIQQQVEERWRAEMLAEVYAIRKLLERLVEDREARGDSYSVTVEPDVGLCDRTDSLTNLGG